MSCRQKVVISFLILIFYPIAVTAVTPVIYHTPFDSETIERFIKPFYFDGQTDPGWAIMESTKWDIFRPVYSLTFLGDFRMWGTDHRMYHLTDVLLSWICYIIAFLLFRRRFGLLTAALALVLWALNPVQAWSIINMTGRNDHLLTVFIACALLLHDISIDSRTGRNGYTIVILVCLLLAVLSKETGIFYSILLFGWSTLVRKQNLRDALRSDAFLWAGIVVLGIMFALLRFAAGFSPSADAGGFQLGFDYLQSFSHLVLMGFPGNPEFNPVAVFTVTFAVLLFAILCRRLPGEIRFGAFGFLVFIVPFPFFWIQHSFLWGVWLWGTLAIAGILNPVYLKLSIWKPFAGRVVFAAGFVSVIVLSCLWSRKASLNTAGDFMTYLDAVRYMVSVEEGPVYSGDIIRERYSVLADGRGPEGGVEFNKKGGYLDHLIQIETGNPESRIAW